MTDDTPAPDEPALGADLDPEITREQVYEALCRMIQAHEGVRALVTNLADVLHASGLRVLSSEVVHQYVGTLVTSLQGYSMPEALFARLVVDTEADDLLGRAEA